LRIEVLPLFLFGTTYERKEQVDSWLAGFQPVRNTRAVLSMVSAYDDALVSKESIAPNHKSLYLDRLFASTISKVSVKDCGLNHSKVATLV